MSCRRHQRLIGLLLTVAYLLGVVGAVSHSHPGFAGHSQDRIHYHSALTPVDGHCAQHPGDASAAQAVVDVEDKCCIKVPTSGIYYLPLVVRDRAASHDAPAYDTPCAVFEASPCSRIVLHVQTAPAWTWVTRLRTVVLLV